MFFLAGIINKIATLENTVDEIFVRRFLIEENNSYGRSSHGNQEPLPESKGLLFAKRKEVSQLSWYQENNVSCGWNNRCRSIWCHIEGKINCSKNETRRSNSVFSVLRKRMTKNGNDNKSFEGNEKRK